jgi:nucleotide-binding universal stress UspA family protein
MNVLVAIDDSAFAAKALDQAIRLAKLETSEIVLLHVVPQLGAIDEMSPGITDRLKAAGDHLLQEAAEKVKSAGIKAKTVQEQGISPADNIINFAAGNSIDIVVMGHRGKSNLEKFLLGSVALRVVSHAACSVMVVK